MDPILFEFGALLGAFTLILYAVTSFFTGVAFANGATVRELVEPSLKEFRSTSPKKRDDLADATVLVAVGLAVLSAVVEQSLGAVIFGGAMFWARPRVRKLTSSEHILMSLGSQFSADLVVGLVAPLAMAHLLLGAPILALAHVAMVVALCWPAGGPGRRDGQWKPAWVVA